MEEAPSTHSYLHHCFSCFTPYLHRTRYAVLLSFLITSECNCLFFFSNFLVFSWFIAELGLPVQLVTKSSVAGLVQGPPPRWALFGTGGAAASPCWQCPGRVPAGPQPFSCHWGRHHRVLPLSLCDGSRVPRACLKPPCAEPCHGGRRCHCTRCPWVTAAPPPFFFFKFPFCWKNESNADYKFRLWPASTRRAGEAPAPGEAPQRSPAPGAGGGGWQRRGTRGGRVGRTPSPSPCAFPAPSLAFRPSSSRPRPRALQGPAALPPRSRPAPRPPAAGSALPFALPLFVLLREVLIRELLGRRLLSLLYVRWPHGGVLST